MKNRIVIGLIGENGSGKDTVANYLQERYEALTMRFADPLKETLSIYFERFSREDQQWLALEFRKRFGNDILSRALRKKIDDNEGLIVVNGLRFWEDYHFIKSFTNSYNIYITADQKIRWERSTKRGEKTDDAADFARFQELEKVETEVNIPDIGAKADYRIINEKDLNYLLSETDKVIEEILARHK
ncbi:MAG: AAA family ATPase [Candidatus Moranbacteria bacterium]|jgi:dephospho-CoA kinase|nr:AAA family ATPase [Candidatus Moranbacteria bacterium]